MSAKFFIYRNLHTGGFSIKHKGKVIERSNSFVAEDIVFKVNEKGRQRVIKEKKKNVHAYSVANKYKITKRVSIKGSSLATYNPYSSPNFISDGVEIFQAKKVAFLNGKCYIIEK
jgi:hypothetical protein